MTRPAEASIIFCALACFAPGCAAGEPPLRITPQEALRLAQDEAGPGSSGMAGIRSTVLAGDPTRPGPYTIRLEVPAHLDIPAHVHRDGRSAVVVSGQWSIGYGDRFDAAGLKRLPPGSFYTEPADAAHFARAGDAPVVVYISGFGPTDTRPADPPDATKKHGAP